MNYDVRDFVIKFFILSNIFKRRIRLFYLGNALPRLGRLRSALLYAHFVLNLALIYLLINKF